MILCQQRVNQYFNYKKDYQKIKTPLIKSINPLENVTLCQLILKAVIPVISPKLKYNDLGQYLDGQPLRNIR